MAKDIKNAGASVRARLLTLSKASEGIGAQRRVAIGGVRLGAL